MKVRDIYLFIFASGVALVLVSFCNVLSWDFNSQILWGFIGIVLVVIGAILLGKQSKPEKRVTLGSAFYFFGKGIYIVLKGLAKNIGVAYRNSQKRRRIEAKKRAHYRETKMEGRAFGEGMAQGFADVREEERIRRLNERDRRDALRRFENQMFPKVNEDAFIQDFYPKKRKKRR